MPQQLDTPDEAKLDPRVARTRRLLLDSFSVLLTEHKSIRAISIQSIAARAGVNRVTFYAHFADKYELMSVWKRDIFRRSLDEKLPGNLEIKDLSIELLIDTMLEFQISYRRYFRRINKEFEPLFETALQQELKAILIQVLNTHRLQNNTASIENTATFLSWAIFGSANEWSRDRKDQSKDQITEELKQMVTKVIGKLNL